MNEVKENLETMVKEEAEKIFEQKKIALGLENVVLDLSFIEDAPIGDNFVYGEAFPFEEPPRVWLEVVAIDARTEEIIEILCEELVHVKHPELKHDTDEEELKEKIQQCVAIT